jgi:hypothetical protein
MAGERASKRAKTSKAATMAATVKEMDGSLGFDAVVVCTSNVAQEQYWQDRLEVGELSEQVWHPVDPIALDTAGR